MAIDVVNIRAKIKFTETGLEIVTPYILSFNINKKRGGMSDFNMSVKVNANQISDVTGEIKIYAGVKNNIKLIFTGYVKKVVPSPVWKNPGYIMLNISGYDILSRLENKRFTRRQEYSDSSWAIITSVREGLKSTKMKYASSEPKLVPTSEGLVEKPERDTIRQEPVPNQKPNTKENPGINIEATIGYLDQAEQ